MRQERRGVALRLFLTAWVLFGLHFATNIVREHYPAFSLAERGTLRVDPYLGLHPDLFEIPGRGGFINNNPGTSLPAALPYALVRPLVDAVVARVDEARAARGEPVEAEYETPYPLRREFFRKVRERGLDVRFGLASAVIHVGYTAPLSALSVVVMWRLLLGLGFGGGRAVGLALLYGFGTPVFFRSGYLNQNLTVALLAFFAFALLHRPGGAAPGRGRLLAAGLLTGFTVVCDYSGVVPIVVLGLYALARLGRSPEGKAALPRAGWMVLGGAATAALLLLYQAWAFGDPWAPAQRFMPDTPYSVAGWHGLTWPAADLAASNLFDPAYGLFVAGPLLLLAFAAPALRPRPGAPRLEGPELAVAFGMFAGIWLFASSVEFARLQWNTGVRYLLPAVPFLFLPAAVVWTRLPAKPRLAVAGLAVAVAWSHAMVRESPPESLATVLLGGLQLPWLSVLGRMGGQYVPVFAQRPPDPTWLVVAVGAALALLWAPRRAEAASARVLRSSARRVEERRPRRAAAAGREEP